MRKLAEEGRRADDHIYAVHARLDSNTSVVHMAADVSEDFGFQTELADGFAISP